MVILSKRNNVHGIEGRAIVPGVNVIKDDAEGKLIAGSAALKAQIDGKFMELVTDQEVLEGSKGGKLSETLAALNAKKASALVKETLDINAIREALESDEARATVLRALEAQEKILAPDPKDKDKDKD